MISRRTMLFALAAAALFLAAAGAAAQVGLPRVAVVDPDERLEDLRAAGLATVPAEDLPTANLQAWRTFFDEFRRLGHVEEETVRLEYWSAFGIADLEGRNEVARSIHASRPDLIVTRGPTWVPQLASVVTDIPIVAIVGDPIESGLAVNVGRPEGNVTGFALRPGGEVAFDAKLIQLLVRLVPDARRVAWVGPIRLIFTPGQEERPAEVTRILAEQGIEVVTIATDPASPSEADTARWMKDLIAAIVRENVDAVYFAGAPEFQFRDLEREEYWPNLLLEAGLPSVTNNVGFVRAHPGAVASYGTSSSAPFVPLAQYADRVLAGVPIADLPFQMSPLWFLRINQRAADALGVEIPPDLLLAAEIVE